MSKTTHAPMAPEERRKLLLIAGQEICKRGYSPREAAEVLGFGGATDERAVSDSPAYRRLAKWHKKWVSGE